MEGKKTQNRTQVIELRLYLLSHSSFLRQESMIGVDIRAGILEGEHSPSFFARHTLLFIDYIIIQYSFIFCSLLGWWEGQTWKMEISLSHHGVGRSDNVGQVDSILRGQVIINVRVISLALGWGGGL